MTSSKNDRDIDQLLQRYFQREMPSRWPSAPGGKEIALAGSRGASLSAGRLLVGVSLASLLALYMGLANFFPREQGSGLNPNGQPQIGQKPGIPTKVPIQQKP